MTILKSASGRMLIVGVAVFLGWASHPVDNAVAEASGPDFFKVVGVAANDVLNIRAEAGADHAKIGEIPPDADGIRNMGCIGGLSFVEWAEASESERSTAAKKRWCKVKYIGIEGWVAGRFLGEGTAPVQAPGSLWRIVSIDGIPTAPEAELGFGQDGRMFGSVGCNRFQGQVTIVNGALIAAGPFAATRMACVDETVATQEQQILSLLEASPQLSYDPLTDRLKLLGIVGAPVALMARKLE